MTTKDDLATCYWCQEDAPEESVLVGFEVTAGSGPDGQPLYRCASCGPKATRTPAPGISQELAEAIAVALGAEHLRGWRDDGR